MHRLNDRAFQILIKEIQRLTQADLEPVRRDILLRRLNKLREQPGPPLTYEELKAELIDIFPEIEDKVLQKAARLNQGSVAAKLGLVRNLAIGSVVAVGSLWVLNLPYPMIRWPVARTAPILLLPSYLSMDHSYRQATSLVEQADQLVNQATSAADIELGAEKVAAAQKHLDRLPVWFLGYYPRAYCTLLSCTWRFTYDEFKAARAAIGRMEAKVFQEQNALELLEQGTTEVDAAKQRYQAAQTAAEKTAAISDWQSGMDKLNEIPPETFAGRSARTKLEAYQRDFSQVSGLLEGGQRATTLIEAAKQFAWKAADQAQNPPHNADTWQRIAGLWEQAIARLEQVPLEDAGYDEAQRLLVDYQNNLEVIRGRLAAEQRSAQWLNRAEQKTTEMLAKDLEQLPPNQIASLLQSIINDLEKVESGTTAYPEAQAMLQSAEAKLQQLI